ncbi:DUF624 domain-containing protein [Chloroflexota bacterium]
MRSSGSLVYRWLEESWHNLWELVAFNFLWFVLTLPVVTAPAAAAGLFYATNLLAHEKPVGWRTFFEGFREHFWLSWRWGAVNLFAVLLFASNILFYKQFQTTWSGWLRGIFWGLALLWSFLQVFTFPLLLEQSDQRIFTALRNSLVLYLRRPGLAVLVAAFVLALAFLSAMFAWPLWVVLVAGLGAYLANLAVLHILKEINDGE